MKYFLLIGNDDYYPSFGAEDWIGTYESKEEATNAVVQIPPKDLATGFQYKAFSSKENQYKYFDTFVVVDLRDWIENDVKK